MSLFHYLMLFDVIAILIIATIVYRLSISRPEDHARTHMAAVVRGIVNSIPWKKSAGVGSPRLEDSLEADIMARMVLTSRQGPASGDHAGERSEQVPHITRASGRGARANPR